MSDLFVVFGNNQHVFGLTKHAANDIADTLHASGFGVQVMSEHEYRNRHGYQGRVSTD